MDINFTNIQDIAFLISSYVIVSDNEIHSNEIKIQQNIYNPSEAACLEHNKILSDAEDKIPLTELLDKFSFFSKTEDKNQLIINLFSIIYADGYYHSKERKSIPKIALTNGI